MVVAGLALFLSQYLRSSPGGLGVGARAPLFESTDLAGRPVALATYRGRTVLLNFWASWCIPCRSEFPVLEQLQARHSQLAVLGVVFEDTDGSARAFLQAEGATWPGVKDPRGQIASAYGVHQKPGIPVSVLIDAGGRIRNFQYGPLADEASAEAFLRRAGPPGA